MPTKRVPTAFYHTSAGNEPVRVWLWSLNDEDRKVVGDDIKILEFSWPVGMPLCRSMSGAPGLWEVRSNLSGSRIARVLFCLSHDRLVLLHGFMKKTQKTPQQDIDLAVKRMKELS
jgi:phage-related protein